MPGHKHIHLGARANCKVNTQNRRRPPTPPSTGKGLSGGPVAPLWTFLAQQGPKSQTRSRIHCGRPGQTVESALVRGRRPSPTAALLCGRRVDGLRPRP